MKIPSITNYRQLLTNTKEVFYTDLFNDDIWGDNGCDIASVTIHTTGSFWNIHYVRVQDGIPYPFAQHVSIVIDEYEKELNDEQFYDYLTIHNLLNEFETYVNNTLGKK